MSAVRFTTFDPSNGLVFTEQTIAARPREEQWTPRIRRRGFGSGASTLEAMALREVLGNVESITPDALRGLPWPLGQKIWQAILRLHLDHAMVWTSFAKAYPDQPSLSYYDVETPVPTFSLPEYIKRLDSPNFLTSLTLCDLEVTHVDVINISLLTNLVTLELRGSPRRPSAQLVDDNMLRTWGRRAREAGALPHLRVMQLDNQEGVTARCLDYLNMYPALAILALNGFAGGGVCDPTPPQGWTCKTTTDRLPSSRGCIAQLLNAPPQDTITPVAQPPQAIENSSSIPMTILLTESHDFLPQAPPGDRAKHLLRFKLGRSSSAGQTYSSPSATVSLLVCRTAVVVASSSAREEVRPNEARQKRRKMRRDRRVVLEGLWG